MEKTAAWRLKNPEKAVIQRRKDYARYQNNPAAKVRHNGQTVAHARKRKLQALEHYGGKCTCCGESEEKFLTFDHINNDGNEHRKTARGKIASWLHSHGYPKGVIQILCWNCNLAKEKFGVCPHQEVKD